MPFMVMNTLILFSNIGIMCRKYIKLIVILYWFGNRSVLSLKWPNDFLVAELNSYTFYSVQLLWIVCMNTFSPSRTLIQKSWLDNRFTADYLITDHRPEGRPQIALGGLRPWTSLDVGRDRSSTFTSASMSSVLTPQIQSIILSIYHSTIEGTKIIKYILYKQKVILQLRQERTEETRYNS